MSSERTRPDRTDKTSQYSSFELGPRRGGSEPVGSKSSGLKATRSVEIVFVMAGHQPYGFLISQVYNIIRGQIKLLSLPDPAQTTGWGLIEYQGEKLPVIELARILQMPLVEPINRSKILLGGKLQAGGVIEQPFGVAVDDVLAVRNVSLENLRVLPGWLCRKKLGKLVWGLALVNRTELVQQSSVGAMEPGGLLESLPVENFMVEAMEFTSELVPDPGLGLTLIEGLRQPIPGAPGLVPVDQNNNSPRPVVLLDLSVFKGAGKLN